MSITASIVINECITIVAYILSFIAAWYCSGFFVSYLQNYTEKKIKVEVNHAGNQEIPEFYDRHGNKKCITFEISEDSTITEVKDEIAKRVKYTDRTYPLLPNHHILQVHGQNHAFLVYNALQNIFLSRLFLLDFQKVAACLVMLF